MAGMTRAIAVATWDQAKRSDATTLAPSGATGCGDSWGAVGVPAPPKEAGISMTTRLRHLTIVLLLGALGLLAGCGGSSMTKRMDGAWANNMTFVYFDFNGHSYIGAGPESEWRQDLVVVEEKDNLLVFSTNGRMFTARFEDDGTLVLQRQGNFPAFPLERVKDDSQAALKVFIEQKLDDGEAPPLAP